MCNLERQSDASVRAVTVWPCVVMFHSSLVKHALCRAALEIIIYIQSPRDRTACQTTPFTPHTSFSLRSARSMSTAIAYC
jgi:hypothetical protein